MVRDGGKPEDPAQPRGGLDEAILGPGWARSQAARRAGCGGGPPGAPGAGGRILVVEDEESTARWLVRTLGEWGHECDTVSDGKAAAHRIWLTDSSYDLVICDLFLPGVSGRAFLEQVRPALRHRTPIIVISRHPSLVEALGELRRGAVCILEKPRQVIEQPEVFREAVEHALDQRALYCRLEKLQTKIEMIEEKNRQLVALNDQLFEDARVDPLTRLPNRVRLYEDLRVVESNWRRHASPFALAVVDIDDFGRFNKKHGLSAGDAALQIVSATLSEACRDGDLVFRLGSHDGEPAYRFGGDEFVLILAAPDESAAATALDRIRRRVLDRQASADRPCPGECATISGGLAASGAPESDRTMDSIFQAANERLRAAKRAGGNCIRPLPPGKLV